MYHPGGLLAGAPALKHQQRRQWRRCACQGLGGVRGLSSVSLEPDFPPHNGCTAPLGLGRDGKFSELGCWEEPAGAGSGPIGPRATASADARGMSSVAPATGWKAKGNSHPPLLSTRLGNPLSQNLTVFHALLPLWPGATLSSQEGGKRKDQLFCPEI